MSLTLTVLSFADPRKSKVDIVQALGRALRKKEGKDWGLCGASSHLRWGNHRD